MSDEALNLPVRRTALETRQRPQGYGSGMESKNSEMILPLYFVLLLDSDAYYSDCFYFDLV